MGGEQVVEAVCAAVGADPGGACVVEAGEEGLGWDRLV